MHIVFLEEYVRILTYSVLVYAWGKYWGPWVTALRQGVWWVQEGVTHFCWLVTGV